MEKIMAWYDESIFYHIYPLGLCDAPKQNEYGEPVHRLRNIFPWIEHIKALGCNAIYIGPLFESVGHGYETTDYKKLDSRLGDNADLKEFVSLCHNKGIRVILDGVFNHTGRDFFAFQDIKKNRENSRYRDWYCNVNFWGNNEYNDGFSYANWGGYNLLVKLNQRNPEVKNYIYDVIRFWVSEFDIDGIRLDAADVLDFDFMRGLRGIANEVKSDFWLMGEVIHGDYIRWVNEGTLHSVTNYHLHKALYSGHNDHNYFEIAHTVKRLYDMGKNEPNRFKLYNFVDNHDVERIFTKLRNKEHFMPTHILMYTLPGIPSIYYGSEFAIEGRKERYSDASLRPALSYEQYKDAVQTNRYTSFLSKLGQVRQKSKALCYGDYRELLLTTRQYAFSRTVEGECVVTTVNNDDSDYVMTLPVGNAGEYIGALSGQRVSVVNGTICVNVRANSGDIWVPYCETMEQTEDLAKETVEQKKEECLVHEAVQKEIVENETIDSVLEEAKEVMVDLVKNLTPVEEQEPVVDAELSLEEAVCKESTVEIQEAETETVNQKEEKVSEEAEQKPQMVAISEVTAAFEKGRIQGLQEAIIAIMERNGYVTDRMRQDVYEQTHIPSLINWVKSFR